MDANYKPSLEDILRSRERTKGFSDIKFAIDVSFILKFLLKSLVIIYENIIGTYAYVNISCYDLEIALLQKLQCVQDQKCQK